MPPARAQAHGSRVSQLYTYNAGLNAEPYTCIHELGGTQRGARRGSRGGATPPIRKLDPGVSAAACPAPAPAPALAPAPAE